MPHNTKEKIRAYRKKWWKNLSPERKREKQEKNTARARAVKVFIAKYKLERGCIDCGYNKHHTALEFDHVTGEKKLNVCFAKSVRQAQMEIDKCEVVCANCHRVRTYKRLYPCKPDIFEMTYVEVENENKN